MDRSNNLSNKKIKNIWGGYEFCVEEDHSSSCAAAKAYECSFCKRQFRTAQALGGHMNIHRRERAWLRLLPSWTSPNENPNTYPNPNLCFSSPSSPSPSPSEKRMPFASNHRSLSAKTLSYLSFPSLDSANLKAQETAPGTSNIPLHPSKAQSKDSENKVFTQKGEYKVLNEKNVLISLDLKMGLLKDQPKDVDLELRLGYV